MTDLIYCRLVSHIGHLNHSLSRRKCPGGGGGGGGGGGSIANMLEKNNNVLE